MPAPPSEKGRLASRRGEAAEHPVKKPERRRHDPPDLLQRPRDDRPHPGRDTDKRQENEQEGQAPDSSCRKEPEPPLILAALLRRPNAAPPAPRQGEAGKSQHDTGQIKGLQDERDTRYDAAIEFRLPVLVDEVELDRLGDDIARALPELRAHAESMMRDTCTVERHTGNGVWNPLTGLYTDDAPTVIYSGPCRVRNMLPNPQQADAGEAAWSSDLVYVHLPVAGSEGVSDGDVVRITSAANDAALVDLELAVTGLHVETNATDRRLPCRLVTRDA